jgi:hypothetical protein
MTMVIFGLGTLALIMVLAAVRANRPFARNRRLIRKRAWQHRAVAGASATDLVWGDHHGGAHLWAAGIGRDSGGGGGCGGGSGDGCGGGGGCGGGSS